MDVQSDSCFFTVVDQLIHRKILGDTIRLYRTRAGFTQEKLAERAELHHNFVGEVERGNMECSVTSLVKIAKALNVSVRDLVCDI